MNWALLFLALAPIVALAYIVWAYRRKAASHEAVRRDRLARILDPNSQRTVTADPSTPPASPAELPKLAAAQRATAAYARRSGLLDAGDIRLREALRAALPGHELFAHVSLAALIEVSGLPEGREREQRLRVLAHHTVDCVVCDRTFGIVAVIDLEDGQTADRLFKAECFRAAGIRYLRWHAAEIPRSDGIAALITGE